MKRPEPPSKGKLNAQFNDADRRDAVAIITSLTLGDIHGPPSIMDTVGMKLSNNSNLQALMDPMNSLMIMPSESMGNADVGFLRVMIPFRQSAIDRSRVEIEPGDKEETSAMTERLYLSILVPVSGSDAVEASVSYQGPVQAPITKGQEIAELVLTREGLPEMRLPLVAEADVPTGGFMPRMQTALSVLMGKAGLTAPLHGTVPVSAEGPHRSSAETCPAGSVVDPIEDTPAEEVESGGGVGGEGLTDVE